MQQLTPRFVAFAVSGAGIAVGMLLLALPLLRTLLTGQKNPQRKHIKQQELLRI